MVFSPRVMFWVDWGAEAKIERANYDGSDRRKVVSYSLLKVNALALDTVSKYHLLHLSVCQPVCCQSVRSTVRPCARSMCVYLCVTCVCASATVSILKKLVEGETSDFRWFIVFWP